MVNLWDCIGIYPLLFVGTYLCTALASTRPSIDLTSAAPEEREQISASCIYMPAIDRPLVFVCIYMPAIDRPLVFLHAVVVYHYVVSPRGYRRGSQRTPTGRQLSLHLGLPGQHDIEIDIHAARLIDQNRRLIYMPRD